MELIYLDSTYMYRLRLDLPHSYLLKMTIITNTLYLKLSRFSMPTHRILEKIFYFTPRLYLVLSMFLSINSLRQINQFVSYALIISVL